MAKYCLTDEIGEGSYGSVFKATNCDTNEFVAIKKLKRKYSEEEVMNCRELKALCKLTHPNIVELKEHIFHDNQLYFVFEYMDKSLYGALLDNGTGFSEETIKHIMYQILVGLSHMHNNEYIHRDIKLDNILVKGDVVKIGDLGLARETDTSSCPLTAYVCSRWYRAPEVILNRRSYGTPADMWSVGAVLAELFNFAPIFPGESEIDQLDKICSVLGPPEPHIYAETNSSKFINFNFFQMPKPENIMELFPTASLDGIDLFMKLCAWDPKRRLTAEQALQHPFFYPANWVPEPVPILYPDPFMNNIVGEYFIYDVKVENSDDLSLELTIAPPNPVMDYNYQMEEYLSKFDSGIANYYPPSPIREQSNFVHGELDLNLHLSSHQNVAVGEVGELDLDLHLCSNYYSNELMVDSAPNWQTANFFE